MDGLSRDVTVSRKAVILFSKYTVDAVDLPMRPARCYILMQFCIRELRYDAVVPHGEGPPERQKPASRPHRLPGGYGAFRHKKG